MNAIKSLARSSLAYYSKTFKIETMDKKSIDAIQFLSQLLYQ